MVGSLSLSLSVAVRFVGKEVSEAPHGGGDMGAKIPAAPLKTCSRCIGQTAVR